MEGARQGPWLSLGVLERVQGCAVGRHRAPLGPRSAPQPGRKAEGGGERWAGGRAEKGCQRGAADPSRGSAAGMSGAQQGGRTRGKVLEKQSLHGVCIKQQHFQVQVRETAAAARTSGVFSGLCPLLLLAAELCPPGSAARSLCSRAATQPTLIPSCSSTRVTLTSGFQDTAVFPCLDPGLRHAGLDMCREMNCLQLFSPFLLSPFVLVIET